MVRKISTSFGQYRYNGSSTVTAINTENNYKTIAVSTSSSTDSASFFDILVSPIGHTFQKNQDYYFKVSIPQDKNYEMSFDIQLIKEEDEKTYQFIKNVTIAPGSSGNDAYTVVLYEDLDGNIKAMIPEVYVPGTAGVRNYLYVQRDEQDQTDSTKYRYFICKGGDEYQSWSLFNDLFVTATWKKEEGTIHGVFEMTFRPIDDGFTNIHLKMVRTAVDYNIQRVNDNNTVEFGRKIDLKDVECVLYVLSNLVGNQLTAPTGSLSRIGVWSHPGLVMTINGEEIRVTANKYYELDALPITSLGIVAPANDYSNFFTIDYEYDNSEI